MINDEKQPESSTPWFLERMSSDTWGFALITSCGLTFLIQSILGVERDETGDAWLRVDLMDSAQNGSYQPAVGERIVCAACERSIASVRLSSVVAAIEVWDT